MKPNLSKTEKVGLNILKNDSVRKAVSVAHEAVGRFSMQMRQVYFGKRCKEQY